MVNIKMPFSYPFNYSAILRILWLPGKVNISVTLNQVPHTLKICAPFLIATINVFPGMENHTCQVKMLCKEQCFLFICEPSICINTVVYDNQISVFDSFPLFNLPKAAMP